jgi:hypothetical protein
MMWMTRLRWYGLSLVLAGMPAVGTPATYTFTTIDVRFPGVHDSQVLGINDDGILVGAYTDAGGFLRAFVYQTSTQVFHAVAVDGLDLLALSDINAHGAVVGSFIGEEPLRGFWATRAQRRIIEVPDAIWTEALGLNDMNIIVRYRLGTDGIFHGWRYEHATERLMDVDVPGAEATITNGVNNTTSSLGIPLGALAHTDLCGMGKPSPRSMSQGRLRRYCTASMTRGYW